MQMPKPYDFAEAKLFLKAFIEAKQAQNPQYSGRLLAQKAGFKSSGYLSEILSGKRKISTNATFALSRAMGLEGNAAEYFICLVQYSQAKDGLTKDELYDQLITLAPSRRKSLLKKHKKLFENWIHIAIRESLAITEVRDFETGAVALAQTLSPSQNPKSVLPALNLLKDLELIEQNPDGRWVASDRSLFSSGPTGGDVDAIRQFQGQMMDLAKVHLNNTPVEERSTLTTTMSISKLGMEKIQKLLEKTQKEVVSIVEADQGEDRIYQLNTQFFPLSKDD